MHPTSETVQAVQNSGSAAAACNDLAFEAIVEACDLATSYAVSAREAAWRGNRKLLAGHLSELRLCILTALEAHKRLSSSPEVGKHG